MEQMMVNAVIPWSSGRADYDYPYADLVAAIVGQAVKDYIKLLRKLWKKDSTIQTKRKLILEKMELESFFHSEWYEALTDMDPDRLISMCQDTALEQEKKQRLRQKRRAKAHQKNHQNHHQNNLKQEENSHETGQSTI